MAKRKKQPGGRGPRRRKPARSRPGDLPELPDRRLMEGLMHQLERDLGGGGVEDDSPEGRAQALLYEAYEERDPERRARLAREALALWPDCADAYVLLAEQTPSRKEARKLYEQALAAGERAIGPRTFQEGVGHFWGILETRPYMRARLGLAHSLWVAGRRDEAVRHLQDMLRRNPNDNQGVRYTLAGFLLFLDRDDDLARLLEQYPDEGSASWAYTKALLAFRHDGDTLEARRLLKQARKTNKHVPDYLLGRKYPPMEQPAYISPGDETEAIDYIGSFLAAWKATPGAIAWLRANEPKPKKKAAPEPKGPLKLVKDWLNKRLAQEDDVWQADSRRLPQFIHSGADKLRPWMVLVASVSRELVLAHQVAEQEPTPAALWDVLLQAMQHPVAGEAHRPTEVQVRSSDAWESLRPHLEEVGVRLVALDELDQMDALHEDLIEHVGGKPPPGLLDMPGVKPEQVASFYEAAAAFYRQAPWKKLGYEATLRVECDKFRGGPWYAVVMGQSGLTMGLALYEDLATLRHLWLSDQPDEENARETVATTVTFGEESETPTADVDAARRHGWTVARPDAYPSAFHKDRGMTMRPPLAWELELLEACLRAVPGFVDRHPQDEPAREELTVPTAAGELRLTLSWVVDETE